MGSALHLGYSDAERATSPYARFFHEDVAPPQRAAREAVATGPVLPGLMPPAYRAAALLNDGYWPVESGYAAHPDGAASVFVLTDMPGVTPAHWDWWFAWHGSEAQRYKLWHPKAHVDVAWADGAGETGAYVGRTSNIVEFVGTERLGLTVRFVPPSEMGLDEGRLAARGEVAICARGGLKGAVIESGTLIHHVRPTARGCEMRSRFWMGGPNVAARPGTGLLGRLAGRAMAPLVRFRAQQAADLLIHCAEEMNHLAGLLPQLHAAFGPKVSEEMGR